MSDRGGNPDRRTQPSPARLRLAEWVTLGVSVLLVGAVAIYLVVQMLAEESPAIAVEMQLLAGQTRSVGEVFVVPVEIRNTGRRTLQDFRGELSYPIAAGEVQKHELHIDYLSERATQTLYVYLPHDPRLHQIKLTPLSYRLE